MEPCDIGSQLHRLIFNVYNFLCMTPLKFLECLRRNDPPNGKIFCESKTYALGSVCHLTCDPGFIPVDQVMTTCTIDKRTHDFAWDVDDSSLMCIEAVSLVIGGIKEDYEYLL